jgi:hypothetical protein
MEYFYTWTPLVILGAVVILALPWLSLIALMLVPFLALAALAALAWAVVIVPYELGQAIVRGLHSRSAASPEAAPVLTPATRHHG